MSAISNRVRDNARADHSVLRGEVCAFSRAIMSKGLIVSRIVFVATCAYCAVVDSLAWPVAWQGMLTCPRREQDLNDAHVSVGFQ